MIVAPMFVEPLPTKARTSSLLLGVAARHDNIV
jgi:hypothetical protein